MRIALWDTHWPAAAKDLAGGLGAGRPSAAGLGGRCSRMLRGPDRRPVPLLFAHLAAVFGRLGHRVAYTPDRTARGADLVVFCPSLPTLHVQRRAVARLLAETDNVRVLVVGPVASILPEAFEMPGATVVKGEPEQLLWTLDEVLDRPAATVQLGTIDRLDRIPLPDWSPFAARHFRIDREFWRFPTGLIEQSRGCPSGCGHCPHTIPGGGVRFRDPEAVVDEIRYCVERWGFRSFRFCDPLFGLDPRRVFRLAELLGRLPRPVQFSIGTRTDLVSLEMLRVLRRVGLVCIRLEVESTGRSTPRRRPRPADADDRQRELVAACRALGIRTIAGFMIGLPDDSRDSILQVLRDAQALNPTFADFHLATPYPGTEFHREMKDRIVDFNLGHYTRRAPVIRHAGLSAAELRQLQAACSRRFFFRWEYLRHNAHLRWPVLGRLGVGGGGSPPGADPAHAGPPRPMSGPELIRRKGLRQDGPHKRPGIADDAGRPDGEG